MKGGGCVCTALLTHAVSRSYNYIGVLAETPIRRVTHIDTGRN